MYQKYIKRFLDICISLVLMLPIILICFIFGIFIKLEDRGSVFYCSERLGIHRKSYNMFKLRSMKMNAPDIRNNDGSTFNSDNDPRLLRIGKFIRKTSIDELPQVFNVFIGDMSLIGPRPDLKSQGELYDCMNKDQTKFKVKPGITGYAQCNGRNELSWDEKIALDHYYVDHCNFIMDLKIIIKTIYQVMTRKGVNRDE